MPLYLKIFIAVFLTLLTLPFKTFAEIEEASTSIILDNEDTSVLTDSEKENIRITEFYPNPKSSENEWVEIHNKNDHSVILKDWYIDDVPSGGGSPIKFTVTLKKNEYYIIDIDKSLLNNSGDEVTLLDEAKKALHTVSYTKTLSEYSIQKLSDSYWYLTQKTTPNEENISLPTPTPLPSSTYEDIANIQEISFSTNSTAVLSPKLSSEEKKNIRITEFYPNPTKDESEWVEIYNANKNEVTLLNWFIDDEPESGGSPIKFSATIDSNEYKVIPLNTSLLNNSDDRVSLLDENKNSLHIVEYKKSVKQSSIQKLSDGNWYITADLTKGIANLDFDPTKKVEVSVDKEGLENNLIDKIAPVNVPEVLGDSVENADLVTVPTPSIEYKLLKYYKMEQPFTVNRENKVYIVTPDDEPTLWEILSNFYKHAFW